MSSSSSSSFVKDKHYLLSWSLADEEKIKQYTKRITSISNSSPEYAKLANIMIELVQKRHDDHHNATAELGHDWLTVEPLNNPQWEPDMMILAGLNKLLRIYAGKPPLNATTGNTIFKFMAIGRTASTPTPYTTTILNELVVTGGRNNVETTGFLDVSGASIRLFTSYGSGYDTLTIHQMGIMDHDTTSLLGIPLSVHDFGGNAYVHTKDADSFSLGMVLDFVPFGDV